MPRTYLFLVAGLCVSLNAQAATLEPHAMACMMYFRSDAVFVGQVIATKTVPDDGDKEGGWIYTLKVIKSYLGADQPTIDVFTENTSGRLTLGYGKKYLLFAEKVDGRLSISWDQISGELSASKQALKDLDKIMARKPGDGGDVYARVVKYSSDDDSGGVAGVRITVKGEKGSFQATTNGKGWIHLHIPAGHYSGTAAAPGMSFMPYDLSWNDLDTFSIKDGGCVETLTIAEPDK